jgi:peptide/nickel transport system substrate-binding protein
MNTLRTLQTRIAPVALIGLMFALLVLGTAQAQDDRVLVVGHAEIAEAYDPAHAFNPTSGMVNRVAYDTLVTFPDADASSIEPLLAASWTISDDGLTYTFTLREGVTFTDGSALEAEDVVFSYQRLRNVTGQPSFLTDPIASIEAADTGTVVITLNEARPSFLSELANTAFSVTNADAVRAAGGTDAADAAETDTAVDSLDQTSVGTAPTSSRAGSRRRRPCWFATRTTGASSRSSTGSSSSTSPKRPPRRWRSSRATSTSPPT